MPACGVVWMYDVRPPNPGQGPTGPRFRPPRPRTRLEEREADLMLGT